eukprot:SAG31_NODE_525_length_14489_cov_3.693815_3_plen_169_part_00
MRLLRMLAIAASIALHVDGSTGHAGTAAPTCSSRQQTATEHEKIAYFRIAEQRRAARYLESAKSWLKEFRRVGRDEDMQNGFADEDSFVYGWLASQQLFAALTVGKNSTAIMAKAANIAHGVPSLCPALPCPALTCPDLSVLLRLCLRLCLSLARSLALILTGAASAL